MKLTTAISRAMDAVRSSNPLEATRLIQEALGKAGREGAPALLSPGPNIPKHLANGQEEYSFNRTNRRAGLGETLAALRSVRKHLDVGTPDTTFPETENLATRSFTCASGQRDFRLFIPTSGSPCGLIVMLHGCRQTAEDFAVGTNMNAVAEAHNLLVAYPHQPSTANPMSCWNWFRPQDQARFGGEAEIIARLTQSVLAEFELPQRGAFLAGLSAGGAMAAVLGSTYPALYSAVGVHSGLAYKSAHDTNSAFAAMRGQKTIRPANITGCGFQPRLIVFHGAGDQTVAPENATVLWDEAVRSRGAGKVRQLTFSTGRRTVDRRIFTTSGDVDSVEEWIIHQGGHAWSGGNPMGSYTDAAGPNASAEMVRFFRGGRGAGEAT